jgi:pimeloyl-ACP methyl ester carboxylesterase
MTDLAKAEDAACLVVDGTDCAIPAVGQSETRQVNALFPSVPATSRQHAVRINLDLFYDYRKNVDLYPAWQKFMRDRQPKTLIFWGQDDIFFTPAGGEAFMRDLPKAELHRIAAGHFAVEDNLEYISSNMIRFYETKVAKTN